MESAQDSYAVLVPSRFIPVHRRTNFNRLLNKYKQPQYFPVSGKIRCIARVLLVSAITFVSLWKHWRQTKQPYFIATVYDNEEIYFGPILSSTLEAVGFDRRLDQQAESTSTDAEDSSTTQTHTTDSRIYEQSGITEESGNLIHVLQYNPLTKVTNEFDMLVELNDGEGETAMKTGKEVQNYGLANIRPEMSDHKSRERGFNSTENKMISKNANEHSWGNYKSTNAIAKELDEKVEERYNPDTEDSFQDSNSNSYTSHEGSSSNKGKVKNVVLLYGDDWSFNMLGAMGNTFIQTPALDKLAKDGILFTHNCVVASVCMQSRATLYTGQYSSSHQTYKSWSDITMYEPNRWRQTLYPQMMQNGFYVGFFGKYHHSQTDVLSKIPTFHEFRTTRYGHYETRDNITKHVTQWGEDDAIDFLNERPPEIPFFLTVSFFATHSEDTGGEQYRPMNTSMGLYVNMTVPYPKTYSEKHWKQMPYFFTSNNVGRVRYKQRYRTKKMYQHYMKNTLRMATEVDTACGRIINELKRQGVYDETLIIFTTDNGNFHGQHGLAEKWYAYEESLRVPLIIRDPRMVEDQLGTTNDEFTLNIDLAPTILSSVGIKPPSVMQGSDIASLYINADNERSVAWRKEFLYEFQDANKDIVDSIALIRKDFKYIYWNTMNYSQLFDLVNDPYEEYDVFNKTDASLLIEAWDRLNDLKLKASTAQI